MGPGSTSNAWITHIPGFLGVLALGFLASGSLGVYRFSAALAFLVSVNPWLYFLRALPFLGFVDVLRLSSFKQQLDPWAFLDSWGICIPWQYLLSLQWHGELAACPAPRFGSLRSQLAGCCLTYFKSSSPVVLCWWLLYLDCFKTAQVN